MFQKSNYYLKTFSREFWKVGLLLKYTFKWSIFPYFSYIDLENWENCNKCHHFTLHLKVFCFIFLFISKCKNISSFKLCIWYTRFNIYTKYINFLLSKLVNIKYIRYNFYTRLFFKEFFLIKNRLVFLY